MPASTSGRWPIVLAGRARGELRLLAEDKNTFNMVRKKFRELSHGQFTTDNHLPVRGSTSYIPIYRARLGNDLRIIYLIDLESDGFNQYDQQIIRILSVSSRARVSYDFWVKVSKFLRRRGSEYRSRCIQRDVLNTRDGPLHTPASFPHKPYIPLTTPDPELENEDRNLLWGESEMNELHEAVVLEKYIPVTKSLYNSILADMDAVLPIILNPDEKAIVRYQGTSVVIGRSGTGKTTALVYKMRANAQVAEVSDCAGSIRQLFVTRSPVLTRRVASYYNGLIESSEIANKSPEELQIMRQLNQHYQPRDLLEFDNEADLRDDLPDRYSELTDAHFPLFISFDRLGRLLEADALGTNDALALARIRLKRLIDFNAFKHQYWPKFDYNLTRKLDPALVFSEIMGVIKGYGEDLTEDQYLNGLTTKKSPLLANVRREVYVIFKAYKKRCILRGETDTADRVRAILSAREHGFNVGSKVDHLFVDEVQDQLMADIHLLHSLCSNIDGGYWCGDTAQTINVGSSFRIRDLKSFLYEKMLPHANAVLNTFQHKVAAPFSTFELTVNFRSHNGIVKYAASLVQLLYTLFPGSIDHMQPESAPIPGPKPQVFVSPCWDEAFFAECLLNGRPVDQVAPFGPEQAIIVRSDETARSLRARLHNRCNVLTLFESKGLEFDDLILYGFFMESDLSASAWRKIAILGSYEEDGATRFYRPQNIESISPGICSELKQLYVAVTRARHRCWLWDSGPTFGMMKDFWESLKLIKVSESIQGLSLFAESSGDPRQWAQRGEGFFANGLYAVAKTCFERADQEKEVKISDAYSHMSEAGKLPEDSSIARSAYITAAKKMIACTKLQSSHSTATLWYHAASCFESAKEFSRASDAYSKGRFYDRALLVLFEAQDMTGCLEVVRLYSEQIDGALLRRIQKDMSLYFLRQKKYSQLEKLHNGDLEECIELARTERLKVQLKDLLRIARRFEELATEHIDEGSPADAVSCLVHDLKSPSAFQWSRNIIFVFLWTHLGLSATLDSKTRSQANALIELYNSQDDLMEMDLEGLQDVKIFGAIVSQKEIPSVMLYDLLNGLNSASECYSLRATTLRYHALKGKHWLSSSSHNDFSAFLEIWSAYNKGFQELKDLHFPSQDAGVSRLFGLSNPPATDMTRVIVPNRTPLYELISKHQGRSEPRKRASQPGITVASSDADLHIHTLLSNHSRKELNTLSSDLLESRWTQHALSLSTNTQGDPCVSFEDALKSTLLALPILDSAIDQEYSSISSVFARGNEARIRISWSMRLFSFAFSSNGLLGELNSELSRVNNDSSNKLASVYAWVSRTLQLLDPLDHEQIFVTLLVACVALIFELQSTGAALPVVQPSELKKHTRSSMPQGYPRQPNRFTDDVFMFFQRGSQWRVVSMYNNLQRMVRDRWFIDISVLIQLIEQTTREVILAEQAATPMSSGGVSGLIAPRSWAARMVTHPARAGHAYTLKPFSLGDYVNRMWVILIRIYNGIPYYWNASVAPKSHPGLIALRLLWSIMFVMVNLRPDHESTRFVQDVLNQFITKMIKPNSPFIGGFKALGFSIAYLPKIVDRISILAALHQIYYPDEVVMLQKRRSTIHPNASSFGGRIIEFDTLAELCTVLACGSRPYSDNQVPALSSEPINATEMSKPEALEPNETNLDSLASPEGGQGPQPDESEATSTLLAKLPPRPDTPTMIAGPEESKTLSLHDAALRVSSAWRRSVEIVEQRKRLSEFDRMGQLYEQYRQSFPKLGAKASPRDRRALRLIRGPCVNIIAGLRLVVEELDLHIEAINKNIQDIKSTLSQVGSGQGSVDDLEERKMKAEECRIKVLTHCPLDSSAKLLVAKNLVGVKDQTSQAWAAFMAVKDSGMLNKSEQFTWIESLVSNGREVVARATKKLR